MGTQVTTNDSLLLADLDRIAGDIQDALGLEDYGAYEHENERLRVVAGDLGLALCRLRRARREMVDLRERLERRLRG